MNFQIYPFQSINIDSIELGNPFSYGENYNLINLYIKNNDSNIDSIYQPQIHKTSFVIQTPIMFIPQNLFFINDRPFLSLSFNNEENDELNIEFKEWVNNLEMNCYKLIKKLRNKNNKPFKKLKINKKHLVPTIKNDNYSKQQKMIIPINLNTSKCVLTHNGLRTKDHYLPDWNITTPTYGFCVIGFKNIWIKDGAWGINMFCYLTKIMPSHILDPIDNNIDYLKILKQTFKPSINVIKSSRTEYNLSTNEDKDIYCENNDIYCKDNLSRINLDNETTNNIIKNKVLYQNYFKMKKIGVPLAAIINKVEKEGLNPKVLDLKEDEFNLIVNSDKIKLKRNKKVKIQLSKDKRKNYSETDDDDNNDKIMRQNTMSKYEVNRESISNTRINLFNDITSGVKLKKVSPNKNKNKKKHNKKDNRVPSLNQIKFALKNLNKTDTELC